MTARRVIEAWLPDIEAIAKKYVGRGVEFDDLRQEGMIYVWECYRDGVEVTPSGIKFALRDYAKKCRIQ